MMLMDYKRMSKTEQEQRSPSKFYSSSYCAGSGVTKPFVQHSCFANYFYSGMISFIFWSIMYKKAGTSETRSFKNFKRRWIYWILVCFICSFWSESGGYMATLPFSLSSYKLKQFFLILAQISLNTTKAPSLMLAGIFFKISSGDFSYPAWSEQKWFGSQASGSPQSQQPETFRFSMTLWPLWSLFSKQLLQIIQVGSFSQSMQHHATSPTSRFLAQIPPDIFACRFIFWEISAICLLSTFWSSWRP